MIKQAIIPLAGLGTRMLPLTSVTPKELLPINGKPNLEYILDECLKSGLDSAIISPAKILPLQKINQDHYKICLDLIYDRRKFKEGI